MAVATQAPSPPRSHRLVGGQTRRWATSPLADSYLIIFATVILCGIGSLMVLSASGVIAQAAGRSPYYYVLRHLMFLGLGLVGAVVASQITPPVLRRLAWPGLAGAVILLMLVISPLGQNVNGNTNWLRLGPVTFQPSEFAKLALVVWAGAIFHLRRGRLHEPGKLLIPFAPAAGLILGLVLAGRDLGTAVIIAMIAMAILYFVGASWRVLLPCVLIGAIGAAYFVLGSANRSRRIQVFLHPEANPDAASQPMSAIYALASGGWWGTGLGAGRQKWGGLKDGAHTDYIFAVLGEELGLFGVLVVLSMLALLSFVGLRVALKSDKAFNRVVAAGITAWFSLQALVNIMVVMHLLPVLGVPLPLISSGGSALVSCLVGVGILVALARDTPEARAYRASKKSSADRPRMTSVMAVGR